MTSLGNTQDVKFIYFKYFNYLTKVWIENFLLKKMRKLS